MKVKGDYQEGFGGLTVSGTPGVFEIELGEEGSLLFPVDPASWEETFQEGGEIGEGPHLKTLRDSPSLLHLQQSLWRHSSTNADLK